MENMSKENAVRLKILPGTELEDVIAMLKVFKLAGKSVVMEFNTHDLYSADYAGPRGVYESIGEEPPEFYTEEETLDGQKLEGNEEVLTKIQSIIDEGSIHKYTLEEFGLEEQLTEIYGDAILPHYKLQDKVKAKSEGEVVQGSAEAETEGKAVQDSTEAKGEEVQGSAKANSKSEEVHDVSEMRIEDVSKNEIQKVLDEIRNEISPELNNYYDKDDQTQ